MRFNLIGDEVYQLEDHEKDIAGAVVISEANARKIAEALMHPSLGDVNFNFLVEVTCKEFGVNPDDLSESTRKRGVVIARYVVFYVLYHTLGHVSLASVGGLFNKDHATVVHGMKQIDLILETHDALFYNSVIKILRTFIPKFSND